ncbi:MAG: radical SAM protein, partial [Acidimicrobiaceae bacterium]
MTALTKRMKDGLDAPICITWELTYSCNLSCVHCLSSSGRRDPKELTTEEAFRVVDELRDMQVFYVNIGGGEPMIRRDFFEIVEYATSSGVGVKFSTNGTYVDAAPAQRLASLEERAVQVGGVVTGGAAAAAAVKELAPMEALKELGTQAGDVEKGVGPILSLW